MPKKKLFNGSNYIGAPVSDETYDALRKNASAKGVSIADIIRAVLNAWAKSKYAQVSEKDDSTTAKPDSTTNG